MKEDNKIVKFKQKNPISLGIVVLIIIFVYLLITIGMYITKPRISVYEVREGSILKDSAYSALAIREEKTIFAKNDGYVNYYLPENSKAKRGNNIYTLSEQELVFHNNESQENVELTEEQQYALFLEIQEFNRHYSEDRFFDTYTTKSGIENQLQDIVNQTRMDVIRQELKNGTLANTKIYRAKDDGIVAYYTDGLEDISINTVTPEHLNKHNYEKKTLKDNAYIAIGDPLYKLVTSEKWHLFFEITDETYEAIKEKTYVKIRFKKDNQTMWAELSLKEMEDKHYITLTLDNGMIRYLDERFIDIHLILEDETGLKIPKTAETTKDFYVVPKSYITKGGNSNSEGVLRRTTNAEGDIITEFLATDIYYEDEEVVCLDPNDFSATDILIKPESQETFALGEKRELKGVYQVNKGYAVFKQIHILCESDEYYIVEAGNNYGLSNYDHIVLDSSETNENVIVF